jgi:Ca2+-binding RTX toxin-like protein
MADVISGGAGNDVLLGGWGADTFRFDRLQPGTDQIYGFEAWDALNFLNFGYASAADALSHMSQSGTDVVFSDQGETIIIHNTTVTIVGAAIITVI